MLDKSSLTILSIGLSFQFMKATIFREYNKDPTKVVKIEDIDMPKLKPNEVMLKVEAAHTTIMTFGPSGEILLKFPYLMFLEVMSRVPVVEVGEIFQSSKLVKGLFHILI